MDFCLALDLAKLRHLVSKPPGEDQASLASDLFLEGKLGAGKQTNGRITFIDRGKASGNRVGEARRYQLVADPRRPGRNEF